MSQPKYASYADITNPKLKHAINTNCLSTIHLATLVAGFAKDLAAAHEHFAEEIQTIVSSYRSKSKDMKKESYVDTVSTICNVWEILLKETEVDAQAHVDAAGLLMKNVCEPLQEVAEHKRSQAEKLQAFRDSFEETLNQSENRFYETERLYTESYGAFKNCGSLDNREGLRHEFHNAHNDYILQIRASNRVIDEFQIGIPQVLEELDEIYIDTSNTINVAIESHSLLLLTKANEQQRRLENLLKCCRQVNPMLDITYFIKAIPAEDATITIQRHEFCSAEHSINSMEESITNHLIIDRLSEIVLREKRAALQKEALELASYIKQNQDITHSLVNICQRNLANHLYAKVYETQEDMCRKRNEIRIAKMQLGGIRAQIELLTPKQNGTVDDEQEKKNPSMIRGMWKKAFKTLKSSPSVEKLSKKSSFHKKKQNSKEADEEIEKLSSGPVDPVYSLLKCAADLPRSGGKSPSYSRYPSGGDSSGNTSKTSSPSSSGRESPEEKAVQAFSAAALRKKFAFGKASSLEMDDKKHRSYSPSPKQSPKSQRKEKQNLFVALYNFKAKEKDDMDLRAGWRVNVTDSSKKDWWKGKSHGKMGFFPAAYVIPIQPDQRVFQLLQPVSLSDGNYAVKFHKDQVVFQVGDETDGMLLVKAANNRQAMCPMSYLQEL